MNADQIREQQKAEAAALKAKHARARSALRALAAMSDDERAAFIRERYAELEARQG